ncbi:putative acrylyl-CoA reductase AcuI [Anatilimnocola aggregata]|uniref:Putative acrylyl-CoA reductase AcuI n=1 Tax=Anatilimnocola aggregata TaxID=2528021 RepID=A0A517YDU0_9BACT|nr:YhdH/YhfP family quinone oxidoreductase [Anatilimnocola aggregata]QDU28397.1 putative acrylyl-CoA reductase AcuI [Anatilimnocola aggregata]
MIDNFTCFYVEKDAAGKVTRGVCSLPFDALGADEVLVRVEYSSLNYKDALAAGGHPGVVRTLPHVPGIDAAGIVEASTNPRFLPGQSVVITGNDLGAGHWGGWSQFVRIPADWIVPLPAGLSLKETMILGTAGFTAAQCVQALITNGIAPDAGEVVVTGATGGVGSLAVKLLAQLGYQVVAVTGKSQLASTLQSWGAKQVIGRDEVLNATTKPLLSARWAAAVDTVGGQTLTTIVRQLRDYGVVAACGLVGGTELSLSVHPFLLRGVILAGIASAALPYDRRLRIWEQLAGPWRMSDLNLLATEVSLSELEEKIQQILRGEIVGRTIVKI